MKRQILFVAATLLVCAIRIDAQAAFSSSNARRLQGKPIASTAPTNGQTLVYNSTSGQYEPSSAAGGGVTLKANGSTQAAAPSINILPGTGVQLLVGGNATELTLQPVLDAGIGGISLTGDILMRSGGCYNGGQGVYPDWGLAGGATATPCMGPNNSQAGLTFPATGSPELSYYFRLPSDWTSAANNFVARIADQNGASSATNMKFDVSVACPAAGSVAATTFSFNAAVSYNSSVVANGSANDYTFSSLNMTGCLAGGFAVLKIGRDNTGVTPTNYSASLVFAGGVLRYTRQ